MAEQGEQLPKKGRGRGPDIKIKHVLRAVLPPDNLDQERIERILGDTAALEQDINRGRPPKGRRIG